VVDLSPSDVEEKEDEEAIIERRRKEREALLRKFRTVHANEDSVASSAEAGDTNFTDSLPPPSGAPSSTINSPDHVQAMRASAVGGDVDDIENVGSPDSDAVALDAAGEDMWDETFEETLNEKRILAGMQRKDWAEAKEKDGESVQWLHVTGRIEIFKILATADSKKRSQLPVDVNTCIALL